MSHLNIRSTSIQLNLFLEGLSGSSDLPVPIRNTVVLLTRTISGTTAATMKPLLSGPPQLSGHPLLSEH